MPPKPSICQGCSAFLEPGPVPSDSFPDPQLIIVGEAPGYDEVAEGRPFVGAAGGLLWRLAHAVDLKREQCHIMNAARCITKSPSAFSYCWKHFGQPELEKLHPEIPIVALGNEAKNVLAPELSRIGIQTLRGCKKGRITFALHPSFIRRTAQAENEGTASDEKQDLSPTLAYDLNAALRHPAPPQPTYRHQVQIEVLAHAPRAFLSCDIETANHLDPRDGPPTEIGWGFGPGQVVREVYNPEKRELYQAIFDRYRSTFHYGLFDMYYLRHHGYRFKYENWDDLMIGAHLLNPDLPLGLEVQASLYHHCLPWYGKNKRSKESYHATDLDVTWVGWEHVERELKEEGKWSLYQKESKPVYNMCIDIKEKGIRVDRTKMYRMRVAWSKKIEELEGKLQNFARINWDSSQQVMELLYDKWKLPEQNHSQRLGGKRTADLVALNKLIVLTKHPALVLLLYKRQLSKQVSNYLSYRLDDNDFFHPDIAFTNATGRAHGPLLTIQRGPMRSLFLADAPDWEIAYADWERVELWIGAVVSGDKHFQEVLLNTQFHEYVGTRVSGKTVSKKDTPHEYERVKNISHGSAFGRSAKAISLEYGVAQSIAQSYLDWLDREFPIWAAYRERQLRLAETEGKLTNAFGFTRYFWSGNLRGMAFSFDPQSLVAHMMKRCMLDLERELPKPARFLFPWHDAAYITYPIEMREQCLPILDTIMTQPWPELDNWRARTEVKIGQNVADVTGWSVGSGRGQSR